MSTFSYYYYTNHSNTRVYWCPLCHNIITQNTATLVYIGVHLAILLLHKTQQHSCILVSTLSYYYYTKHSNTRVYWCPPCHTIITLNTATPVYIGVHLVILLLHKSQQHSCILVSTLSYYYYTKHSNTRVYWCPHCHTIITQNTATPVYIGVHLVILLLHKSQQHSCILVSVHLVILLLHKTQQHSCILVSTLSYYYYTKHSNNRIYWCPPCHTIITQITVTLVYIGV